MFICLCLIVHYVQVWSSGRQCMPYYSFIVCYFHLQMPFYREVKKKIYPHLSKLNKWCIFFSPPLYSIAGSIVYSWVTFRRKDPPKPELLKAVPTSNVWAVVPLFGREAFSAVMKYPLRKRFCVLIVISSRCWEMVLLMLWVCLFFFLFYLSLVVSIKSNLKEKRYCTLISGGFW